MRKQRADEDSFETFSFLFSASAEETKKNAIALRRSEHFLLAKKFWAKDDFCVPFQQSLLPPPLNGGWYVWTIFRYLISKILSKRGEWWNVWSTWFWSLEKCRKGEPFAITDRHECWASCVKSERWVDAALSGKWKTDRSDCLLFYRSFWIDCITKNPELLISYNSTQDTDERDNERDINRVIANCILGTKLRHPKISSTADKETQKDNN